MSATCNCSDGSDIDTAHASDCPLSGTLSDERRVLAELYRLYKWRFELAAQERQDREFPTFLTEATKRLLRQYGTEKKAAWAEAARVLGERE